MMEYSIFPQLAALIMILTMPMAMGKSVRIGDPIGKFVSSMRKTTFRTRRFFRVARTPVMRGARGWWE